MPDVSDNPIEYFTTNPLFARLSSLIRRAYDAVIQTRLPHGSGPRRYRAVWRVGRTPEATPRYPEGPYGIAIDRQGTVYVYEPRNRRVKKFTSEGIFTGAFSTRAPGIMFLQSLSCSPQGNVFMDDTMSSSGNIRQYTSDGDFICSFTSRNPDGVGTNVSEQGVAVDQQGDVFVIDDVAAQVRRFTSEGTLVSSFETGGREYYRHLVPICEEMLAWMERLEHISGPVPENVGEWDDLFAKGTVAVSESREYLAGYLTSMTDPFGRQRYEGLLTICQQLLEWVRGAGADTDLLDGWERLLKPHLKERDLQYPHRIFDRPSGIALDPEGHVYICSRYGCSVTKFTCEGTFITSFGTRGSHKGELGEPIDLAADHLGNVFLTDRKNLNVQKFTSDGIFICSFGGGTGRRAGQFRWGGPEGIATDSQGNVYVTSPWDNTVQKFAPIIE